jgi:hypothetical protein
VSAQPLGRRVMAEKLPREGLVISFAADAAQRADITAALGLPSVHAFAADLTAGPTSSGRYRVTGEVKARIGQTCVLSGDDFDTDVTAPVDAVFADDDRLAAPTKKEIERTLDDEDPPEPLDGGAIDLGALAVEFLALALDPFPKKPGAAFEAPETERDASPFAALAALKGGDRR